MKTHDPRWMMYPYWLFDFLTDPRVLHNVSSTIKEGYKRNDLLNEVSLEGVLDQKPFFVLSFDIERDMDQPFESSKSNTAKRFLEDFLRISRECNLQATFFVQGEMIPELAPVLKLLLEQGNEIGLHGYSHELWGRTNWVTHRPPIKLVERKRRLNLALQNFEQAGLPRPIAFRAPNFTIDHHTYDLLYKQGFKVDSSIPTQRGIISPFIAIQGLNIVPVSCGPLPKVFYNPRLKMNTAVTFPQFNFDTFIKSNIETLTKIVEETLRYQFIQKIQPNLVIYAHNWEFAGLLDATGKDYFDILVERVLYLLKIYRLHMCTISEVAENIRR